MENHDERFYLETPFPDELRKRIGNEWSETRLPSCLNEFDRLRGLYLQNHILPPQDETASNRMRLIMRHIQIEDSYEVRGILRMFLRLLMSLRVPDFTETERYRKYIQSDLWREKRADALMRAHSRCQVCNSPHRLEVHHRTYENFEDEFPQDLTVLCDECHRVFHQHRQLYRDGGAK